MLAFYDRAFFFLNGQLLGESSGGSVEYQGEPIAVATLAKDLAGFTPVPKSAMVSVESFVPAKGFDFDVVDTWYTDQIVTAKMQMGGSGMKMQADGMILPPSISTSATDSTKLSFKIHVEAAPFKM